MYVKVPRGIRLVQNTRKVYPYMYPLFLLVVFCVVYSFG